MGEDRQIVRITLFDESDVQMTVPEAVAWLQRINDQIPDEFKDRSVFRVEYESGYYNDGWINFDAWYDRPETDEEMEKRHAAEQASIEASRRYNEARERQIYEQLKRKFENP